MCEQILLQQKFVPKKNKKLKKLHYIQPEHAFCHLIHMKMFLSPWKLNGMS